MIVDAAATRLNDAQDAFDEYEKRLVDQIAEHGWRSTSVGGAEGFAAFTYTTGLWLTFDRPEIVIFDLPAKLAHDLSGLMAREMQQGREFRTGEPVSGLVEGEDVWFLPVGREQADAYLRSSGWFYRGAAFPCWQMVWGDSAGLFPWMAGFDAGLVGVQPDLSTAGDWAGLRTSA